MKNRIAALGLAAVAATTGGIAVAGTSAIAADNSNPQGVTPGARATTAEVVRCDGGRSLGLSTRIVTSPFTFNETAVDAQDQGVPGAGLAVAGPARGTDTLLITFSAETRLTGGTVSDWMGLEVHLDGTPINPFTASGDVLALTAEPSWNSNSMQFCAKVKPGNHVLRTFANLDDNSGATLSGWLDDYTFSVQRFD